MEALSLPAGVVGGFFVGVVVGFVGFFFHVLFFYLFGIMAEWATAAPGFLFDFTPLPPAFFAFFFLWSVAVSPELTAFCFNAFLVFLNFALRDWMRL